MKCYITKDENVFGAVKCFVEELPGDGVVILGYNVYWNEKDLRAKFPNQKLIIYQLEQLCAWYDVSHRGAIKIRSKQCLKALNECDEIWDYDVENILFLRDKVKVPMYLKPLQKCEKLNYHIPHGEIQYDILFYGKINERRNNILQELDKDYKLLVITPNNCEYTFKNHLQKIFKKDLFKLAVHSKFLLNLHSYDNSPQEQVRIFEALSNNCNIISEKSKHNYLRVKEFETIEELKNILNEN